MEIYIRGECELLVAWVGFSGVRGLDVLMSLVFLGIWGVGGFGGLGFYSLARAGCWGLDWVILNRIRWLRCFFGVGVVIGLGEG